MWGPIGVHHRLNRRVSHGISDVCVVLRAVLMVFSCLSIKPCGFGRGVMM